MMNYSTGRATEAPADERRPGDAIRISGLRVLRGTRVVLDDYGLVVRRGTLTGRRARASPR
jgi:hypothetical protein